MACRASFLVNHGSLLEGYGDLYTTLRWADTLTTRGARVSHGGLVQLLKLMKDLPRSEVSDLSLDGAQALIWSAKVEFRDSKEGTIVCECSGFLLIFLEEHGLHATCMECCLLRLEEAKR